MKIAPLRPDLKKILKRHQLQKKHNKCSKLFQQNPKHPSLNTEKLHPKHQGLYSFRIDQKWRAIFIVLPGSIIEIIDINPHYND